MVKGRFVGYRRSASGGTWIARYRGDDGRQNYRALGVADDTLEADGESVLTFMEAQAKARDFFTEKGREASGDFRPSSQPYTVADAIEDYRLDYRRRGGKAEERVVSAADVHILPTFGAEPLSKLTKRKIESWLQGVAESRPKLRTRSGEQPRFRTSANTVDQQRSRKATANRVLTVLKAALNHAYREGRASDDSAWKNVKAYREVDSVRLRYLSDDESRRLVNACDQSFRSLVVAALLTGCRYGELAALVVEDFDSSAGTISVRVSKGARPRHVALTDEGRQFFARECRYVRTCETSSLDSHQGNEDVFNDQRSARNPSQVACT